MTNEQWAEVQAEEICCCGRCDMDDPNLGIIEETWCSAEEISDAIRAGIERERDREDSESNRIRVAIYEWNSAWGSSLTGTLAGKEMRDIIESLPRSK